MQACKCARSHTRRVHAAAGSCAAPVAGRSDCRHSARESVRGCNSPLLGGSPPAGGKPCRWWVSLDLPLAPSCGCQSAKSVAVRRSSFATTQGVCISTSAVGLPGRWSTSRRLLLDADGWSGAGPSPPGGAAEQGWRVSGTPPFGSQRRLPPTRLPNEKTSGASAVEEQAAPAAAAFQGGTGGSTETVGTSCEMLSGSIPSTTSISSQLVLARSATHLSLQHRPIPWPMARCRGREGRGRGRVWRWP
mmetsp:Transcript_40646/g.126782  ORF Transcript_40646/g.126782 Transcript_40646/m.126782 type:complete len:247 (+) Transcript_40646:27-767(+)